MVDQQMNFYLLIIYFRHLSMLSLQIKHW